MVSALLGHFSLFLLMVYIWIYKPLLNSKGNNALFFANIVYTVLVVITLTVIWLFIINTLNLLLPLILTLIPIQVETSLSNESSFKPAKCLDENNNQNTLFKNSNGFFKLFNPNNKSLQIIKPFPLIKQDYMLSKSINNSDTVNSGNIIHSTNQGDCNFGDNQTISQNIYNESVYNNKSPSDISRTGPSEITDEGSDISSFGHTMVIDLVMVKG